MLKHRILTALVLIPLTLLILFYTSPKVFFALTGLLVLLAAWEWSRLMGLAAYYKRILYLVFVLAVMVCVLYVVPMRWIYLAAFGWWIIAAVLVMAYPNLSICWGKGVIVRSLMGVLVLIPCWVGLNTMRNQQDGSWGILFLFVLIWGADSAAYFIGRKWGNKKLKASVSPGKTWIGVIAAFVAAIIIATITLYLSRAPYSIWPWAILLSIVTVLFSILGDLFESMIKRQVNVKDSGSLLPGHGGILDRIDSLTAAVPIFVIGGLLLALYLN